MLGEDGLMFPSEPMKFSFTLESTTKNKLIDNYIGVDFSIVYQVKVTLKVKGSAKPITGKANFYVKVPGGGIDPAKGRRNITHDFQISSD